MAKRSTPKKKQCKSSSSSRYKTFQNKAQKRLFGLVDRMKKVTAKQTDVAPKKEKKVTKIKA